MYIYIYIEDERCVQRTMEGFGHTATNMGIQQQICVQCLVIRVPKLISVHVVSHSYVCQDSFVCAP